MWQTWCELNQDSKPAGSLQLLFQLKPPWEQTLASFDWTFKHLLRALLVNLEHVAANAVRNQADIVQLKVKGMFFVLECPEGLVYCNGSTAWTWFQKLVFVLSLSNVLFVLFLVLVADEKSVMIFFFFFFSICRVLTGNTNQAQIGKLQQQQSPFHFQKATKEGKEQVGQRRTARSFILWIQPNPVPQQKLATQEKSALVQQHNSALKFPLSLVCPWLNPNQKTGVLLVKCSTGFISCCYSWFSKNKYESQTQKYFPNFVLCVITHLLSILVVNQRRPNFCNLMFSANCLQFVSQNNWINSWNEPFCFTKVF